MARFASAADAGYRQVSGVLAGYIHQIQQETLSAARTNQQQDGHQKTISQPGQEMIRDADLTPMPTSRKNVIKIDQLPSVFFTGRQKELDFLHEHLKPVNSITHQRRVVVWGCGGAGKSQLVTQYVCTHIEDFSDIFWVTAWKEHSLRIQYADIARQIDLPEKLERSAVVSSDTSLTDTAVPDLDAQQKAIDAVKEWFSKHETGNWLLIIDNADDLKEIKLERFLPPTMKGNVIITSRNKQAEEIGISLELKGMNAEDAESLLLRRSAVVNPTAHQKDTAARIAKSLGHLALAVEQAGAYIRTVGGTLEEYEESFQADRYSLLSDSYGVGAQGISVMKTFELSIATIEKRNRPAANLFGALGYLDGARIPENIMLNGPKGSTLVDLLFKDAKAYKTARGELLSFSLIGLDTVHGERIISIHPLIHYFSRVRLDSNMQLRLKCVVGHVLVQETSALPQIPMLIVHIMHFCEQVVVTVDDDVDTDLKRILWPSIAQLLRQNFVHWRNEGNMEELERYCRAAVKELDRADSDDARTAMLVALDLHRLAIEYVETTDTAESITKTFLLRHMKPRAISALGRAQSDDNTFTGTNVESSKKAEGSESHHCASLDDVFHIVTPASFLGSIRIFLHHLAVASAGRKHWNQAMLLSGYAELPLTPFESPTQTPAAFSTLFVKAACLAENEDAEAVCDVYRALINVDGVFFSAFGRVALAAVYDCTKFLNRIGRPAEAELVTRRAIDPVVDRATDLSRHSQEEPFNKTYLVWAKKSLAVSLIHQGRLAEARRLLVELHRTCKETLGAQSLSTYHATLLLHILHEDPAFSGDLEVPSQADELLAIFIKLYGSSRARILRGEGLNMGQILLAQGALEEAAVVFGHFATLAGELLGTEHKLTRKAQRLTARAQEERRIELDHGVKGNVMRFGCMTIMRSMEDLDKE
ncbi:MAG: hypothetical protein M1833_003378 [Piccolia ochrophora]|nr:MAG: hypothetical protein M1833_003378 [Piccolia ochrophora]